MAGVNERLRSAAKAGSEEELKALLRDPGCDALGKDQYGRTALMHAAISGHEGCVGLLLPVSDALSQDKDGRTALMGAAASGYEACVRFLLPISDALSTDVDGKTASSWSRTGGHQSLAQFIDAYAMAQSEHADIESMVSPGAPRGRAALRV